MFQVDPGPWELFTEGVLSCEHHIKLAERKDPGLRYLFVSRLAAVMTACAIEGSYTNIVSSSQRMKGRIRRPLKSTKS